MDNEDKLRKKYNKYVSKCKKRDIEPVSFYEWKKNRAIVATAVATGGALASKNKIKSMINGREKVYHGTRNINMKNTPEGFEMSYSPRIDSIKQNGLLKDYGGSNVAALDAAYAKKGLQHSVFKDADKSSEGTIHIAKDKNYASNYGVKNKLHEKQLRQQLKAMGYTHPEDKKLGTVFEIDMPYEDFKKMKPDKKVMKMTADAYNITTKEAEKINKIVGKAYQGPVDINRAAIKDNEYVSKEEKKKYDKEQFSRYVKNNKGRFAGGVALGTVAAGAVALGAYKIIKNEKEAKKAYEKYKKKGGKLNYKEFKHEVLREFYDFTFENFDYVTEELMIKLDKNDYAILNKML